MAKIFPQSINDFDFKEAGEERVFDILKNFPDDYRVWYEVVLGERSRRPDFLLIDPKRGITIIEVKDWGRDTILGASKKEFKVKAKGDTFTKRKNPTRKCKVYVEEASERLELEDILVGKYDRLLFPIKYFVAFPNLSEKDFLALGLGEYLEQERMIFQNEVRNRTIFQRRVVSDTQELDIPLTPEMLLTIRTCLKTENTINAPGGNVGLLPGVLPENQIELADELSVDVFAIDIEQEELAKNLGEGPRLMRGIAGTGKTMIMLMRAKLLVSNAAYQNKIKRVLVLCWNVSLANYMRQAFNSINIPLEAKARTNIYNPKNIPIVHFMDFARQVVKGHPEVGKFPSTKQIDFEEVVSRQLNEVEIKEFEKFDVIIVDEAQDFQDEWLQFLFHKMLRGNTPQEKNFILAADDAQRVYKSRSFTWAGLGIPMTGNRSKILRKVYRNSARVWGFAGFLLGDIKKFYGDNSGLSFTPKRGVDPKLIPCKSLNEQINACVDDIRNIGDDGYSWGNVMVIYHSNKKSIVQRLIQRLDKENIPNDWITESISAKKGFRMERDSVKISTAASAKGLDAPKVIILNAEAFDGSNTDYDENKLMYVAMTRAREELTILYTGDGGIVSDLKNAYALYKKHRNKLLDFEKKASDTMI